jgi:hypothetical protein
MGKTELDLFCRLRRPNDWYRSPKRCHLFYGAHILLQAFSAMNDIMLEIFPPMVSLPFGRLSGRISSDLDVQNLLYQSRIVGCAICSCVNAPMTIRTEGND